MPKIHKKIHMLRNTSRKASSYESSAATCSSMCCFSCVASSAVGVRTKYWDGFWSSMTATVIILGPGWPTVRPLNNRQLRMIRLDAVSLCSIRRTPVSLCCFSLISPTPIVFHSPFPSVMTSLEILVFTLWIVVSSSSPSYTSSSAGCPSSAALSAFVPSVIALSDAGVSSREDPKSGVSAPELGSSAGRGFVRDISVEADRDLLSEFEIGTFSLEASNALKAPKPENPDGFAR